MKHTFALCLLMLLAACGSSPENSYYVLTETPAKATLPPHPGLTVALGAVRLPDYLDRPQIVLRDDANRLDVHEYDRWGEPVEGMVRRVLKDDLALRLGADALPLDGDAGVTVTLDIKYFGVSANHVANLDARWQLADKAGKLLVPVQDFRLVENVSGPGTAAAVTAMSDLLGQLADAIASQATAP